MSTLAHKAREHVCTQETLPCKHVFARTERSLADSLCVVLICLVSQIKYVLIWHGYARLTPETKTFAKSCSRINYSERFHKFHRKKPLMKCFLINWGMCVSKKNATTSLCLFYKVLESTSKKPFKEIIKQIFRAFLNYYKDKVKNVLLLYVHTVNELQWKPFSWRSLLDLSDKGLEGGRVLPQTTEWLILPTAERRFFDNSAKGRKLNCCRSHRLMQGNLREMEVRLINYDQRSQPRCTQNLFFFLARNPMSAGKWTK